MELLLLPTKVCYNMYIVQMLAAAIQHIAYFMHGYLAVKSVKQLMLHHTLNAGCECHTNSMHVTVIIDQGI